jgi:hypothetical protein
MRGDTKITMKEMIDSLTGSLRTMRGTTGLMGGMTIGMMTGRLMGLSQESRGRTVFSPFTLQLPSVLLYVQ